MPRSRRLAAPRFDDKRPPLERLASVASEPGAERSHRMMARITDELMQTPEPGPWIAAAHELAARSVITENAALYLAEKFLECITFHSIDHDPEMMRIQDEIDRVKREHGLGEDDDWYLDEGPAEWLALTQDWDRRDFEIRVAMLRALGHGEIAELLAQDADEFNRRSAVGHREFWGDRIEPEEIRGAGFD
jgi:hypothetical protein